MINLLAKYISISKHISINIIFETIKNIFKEKSKKYKWVKISQRLCDTSNTNKNLLNITVIILNKLQEIWQYICRRTFLEYKLEKLSPSFSFALSIPVGSPCQFTLEV